MVVESVVCCAFEGVGYGAAKKNSERLVAFCLGLDFVKCEQNQRVLHEVRVVEQRSNPISLPYGGESNIGVMAVVGHVGGDECPLRKFLVLQIVVETRKVLDQLKTSGILGDGVEEDQRIMLADIVIREGPLI